MALKAGDPAPDFALPDQHGQTVKLSDLYPDPVQVGYGSEAPGRIAWAMKQGASAIIPKPANARKMTEIHSV